MTRQISRRDFLRLMAAAAGTGALGLTACGGTGTQAATTAAATGAALTSTSGKTLKALCTNESYKTLFDKFTAEIGAEAPKSWADLTNPVFKDEIMMSSPAVSGTNYAAVAALLQTMGEDKGWEYLAQLNDNIPFYTKRGSDPSTRVAAGEAAVGITYIDNTLDDILADGTLSIVYPEEGMPYIPDGVAAFAGADDVEDAKLFIEWLFSSDENLKELADIDKKTTMLLALPDVSGLTLDFDTSQLMDEDLTKFGSAREATLAKWDEVTSGKEIVSNS